MQELRIILMSKKQIERIIIFFRINKCEEKVTTIH